MMLWNSQSIAGKLTRMNLAVCGTALILAYVSFLMYDVYTLRQALVTDMGAEAQIVGSNCVAALTFDDSQAAQNTLAGLRGSPHVVSAVVFTADGRAFASFPAGTAGGIAALPHLQPNETSGYWAAGSGRILFGRRIESQGQVVGSVYILGETTDVFHSARQFGLISAGILLICFLVALLATSTIRRLVSQPLTLLAHTATVVSREKDYSIRAELPRGSDELSLLIGSFNEMLEQIQQRDHALEESRRGLEQKVQERTLELLEANRELEAFSYSVAHDLRGPLQQIINLAFLLQESADTAHGSQSRELTNKLASGTQRMSSLIDDLLNLSRAKSSTLHYCSIDVTRMVQTILAPFMAEKGDRVVEVSIQPGARATADEGLLGLVLENLIRNAWKYSSRRDPARITFGFREEEGYVIFFVEDNGAGFDPGYADRLFRPFQRLHSQAEFPGTGVGLATVQRIVARHGGRVWAEGAIERGARFSFSLPRRPPQAGSDARPIRQPE